jgi:hypothetical protein
MEPQHEYESATPSPSHPGRWQGIRAHVIRFAGSIEDYQNEIEMSPANAAATFDALFRQHLTRLRSMKQRTKQIVAARMQYLHRQATATVRSMFVAVGETRRWPGSDAMELVRSVSVSTILARAKAYAEAVEPEPVWRKSSNVLC